MGAEASSTGLVIGRYVVFDEIASGGMASVHLGRLRGAVGFARTVAIKRLHAHLARDHDFVSMFLDEARIAARIRHPNVVSVLDVVHEGGELFLVMDYVQGESLSRLMRAVRPGVIPPRIAVTAVAGVLHGLHAAHEATTEHGESLEIVHRDVSPQNVILGTDGTARVLDFGVAKASHRAQTTQDGSVKGKIGYMAPEQLLSEHVDRRADVYSAAVVAWEALTGERLFDGDNQGRIVRKVLDEPVAPPSSRAPGLPSAVDAAVMRGLERDVQKRWQSAREFAHALETALPVATPTMIGEWVESIASSSLMDRARRVKEIESRAEVVVSRASRPQDPEEPTRHLETPGRTAPTVPEEFAAAARRASDAKDDAPESAPVSAPSSARLRVSKPSPFAPVPVQTLEVAPLARLDPTPLTPIQPITPSMIPAAKRGRRMLVLGIALALVGVLSAAGAVAWTLLRR